MSHTSYILFVRQLSIDAYDNQSINGTSNTAATPSFGSITMKRPSANISDISMINILNAGAQSIQWNTGQRMSMRRRRKKASLLPKLPPLPVISRTRHILSPAYARST